MIGPYAILAVVAALIAYGEWPNFSMGGIIFRYTIDLTIISAVVCFIIFAGIINYLRSNGRFARSGFPLPRSYFWPCLDTTPISFRSCTIQTCP